MLKMMILLKVYTEVHYTMIDFMHTSYHSTDRKTSFSCAPFYYHGLTLIPAWISNYSHYKVWYEITYPFLNFNGATVEV